MARMSVHIELDRGGVAELLRSAAVQQMLTAKAEAIAAAARARGIRVDGTPGEVPLPIEVHSSPRAKRARAVVLAAHPAALHVEAKHRLLVGSLGAGRTR
jgi:hypothetical protein